MSAGSRAGVLVTGDEAATVQAAPETVAEYLVYQASLTCSVCAEREEGLCGDHAADLEAASEHRTLAGVVEAALAELQAGS